MNKLTVSASPHASKKRSTRSIMTDVLIALTPAFIAAIVFFGYHVVINAVVCMGSCFAFELLYTLIYKKDFSRKAVKSSSCFDLSCLVTGLILALNMPRVTVVRGWNLNVYSGKVPSGGNAADYVVFSGDTVILCIVASLIAIVLVKMLFGGIGKNFANPAATARVFLLLAFSSGMMYGNTVGAGPMLPASTGATWLSGGAHTASGSSLLNMFIGNRGAAAVGETSMIALIIGYVYLCARKVIDFRLPLIIIGSTAVFALLFDGAGHGLKGADLFTNMLAHVMSGGIAFGAVFMATDYSTSPNTFLGSALFGFGIALLTMLIRVFGTYSEGMSFAILVMNITVPLIDKFIVPRPFGYERKPREKKSKQSGKTESGGAKA